MDAAELAQAELEQAQQLQQQAQVREELLARICLPEALERLKRVKLVRREVVEKVERFLEQQAVGGKLRNLVTEAEIIDLLTKVGSSGAQEQKIIIARKRYGDEEEDDDDDDLR